INAHPYRIVVIDPRPTLSKGIARLYEFDVDTPIPTPMIPLNGKDILKFDFGAPYQKTFEESLYGLEFVDYSQFPEDTLSYSPPDHWGIARRILAVNRAFHAGHSLDNPPLPLEAIDLEAALEALQTFGVMMKMGESQ